MHPSNTYEASSSDGAPKHDTCGVTSAKIRWTCCQCGTLNKHPWEYCTGCGIQIYDDCFDQKIASDHNLTMSLPKYDLFGETSLNLMWVCCQCNFLNQHPREYCTRCKIRICDACLSQKSISGYNPTMDLLRGTLHQISSSPPLTSNLAINLPYQRPPLASQHTPHKIPMTSGAAVIAAQPIILPTALAQIVATVCARDATWKVCDMEKGKPLTSLPPPAQDPREFWVCCQCDVTNYPPEIDCIYCGHYACMGCHVEGGGYIPNSSSSFGSN